MIDEARIAGLRSELVASTERATKAVVSYELGHLLELAGNVREATDQYKAARSADPTFRPPLFALLRLHRDGSDPAVLSDLHATEAKVARTPSEEASALLDHAALLEDRLERGKQARALYDRMLMRDPGNLAVSLSLELFLRRASDAAGAARVVAARAEHVSDPVLRRVLVLESALALEAAGQVDAAVEALRTALAIPVEQHRFLRELERITRRRGSVHDRIEVLERLGTLAEKRARGEAVTQGLSAGSLPAYPDDDAARADAASLLREVARLSVVEGEIPNARKALERAIALRPADALLRIDRMEIEELVEDFSAAQKEARGLLERGAGPFAAAIHMRIADLALRKGNRRAHLSALEAAVEADPGSIAATALLHEALVVGAEPAQRITWLEQRATASGTPDPSRVFWQAGRIALDELGDGRRAKALLSAAIDRASRPTPILRELYGGAIRLGDDALLAETTRALLEREDVDDSERSHLLYERFRRHRTTDAASALTSLEPMLRDPRAPAWIAAVLRIGAARKRDHAALAEAHLALARSADAAGESALGVAHVAVAGRALARARDFERARELLAGAVERAPEAAYAMALFEEVLRARGETGSLAELLERAGSTGSAARMAEPLFLRGALAARDAGDLGLAQELLRRASSAFPTSIAPRWLMRRLAVASGDDGLVREALEGLAELESSVGRPSLAMLELGELDAHRGRSEQALRELTSVLPDEDAGPAAAATLLVVATDDATQKAALERLVADAHGASALALRRTLGGFLLDQHDDGEGVRKIASRVLDLRKDERWARWALLCATPNGAAGAEARSHALEGLAQSTSDPAVAVELSLFALASGGSAADRTARLVEEVEHADPKGLIAALALELALPAGDLEGAARALEARVAHAAIGIRAPLEAALARALTLAGRHADATRALSACVARDPEDFASWEALRVSAREAQDWDAFGRATEKLAAAVPTSERAALLAEAGLTSNTQVGGGDEAAARLREALRLDPTHAEAYTRLHEILEAAGDRAALFELVTERIAVVDDADALVKLFWQQAKLAHALGHADTAIDAVRNLHTLDPAHAPGLALIAELHVARGEHGEAVQALRELACVDLPTEERRHARLAAARYLARELGDPAGAVAELKVIESMGLADEELLSRMAFYAERARLYEEAVRALGAAAALAEAPARARYLIRAGTLLRTAIGDEAGAVELYERALEAAPTDISAANSLAELLDRGGRRRLAAGFEEAVRKDLAIDPTSPDHLRKLRVASRFAEDVDFERLVLDAIAVVGAATEDELGRWTELHEYEAPLPTGSLGDAQIAALGARLGGDPIVRLGEASAEVAFAVLGSDLDGIGVGKKQLVRPKDASDERDAVERIGAVFGVASDRFYRGGEPDGDVAVVGTASAPVAWVVSSDVGAPMSGPHRFRAGALAMAVRQGAAALVDLTAEEAVSLLAAIARAADSSLADVDPDAEVVTAAKKALSRGAKKAVVAALQDAPPNVDAVVAHCARARLACAKAGLVVSGDLGAALGWVLDTAPTREAIRASDDATELLRFWLSPAHRTLRADLALDEEPSSDASADGEHDARLERSSGFFGAEGASWDLGVEGLLASVESADSPRISRATGTFVAAPVVGGVGLDERIAALRGLLEKRADVRLWLSLSELAEASGNAVSARRHLADAVKLAPNDPVVLRRRRHEAMARRAFAEVVERLDEESRLPASPEERGLTLALGAVVSMSQIGDTKRAADFAARALSQRPRSVGTALLAAMLGIERHVSLERAAREWKDGKAAAAILVEAARHTVREGDLTRGRFLFKRATEQDGDAFDAWLGLARSAYAQKSHDEASESLGRAARLLHERPLTEGFLRAAARVAHLAAGKASLAIAIVSETADTPAAIALARAAEAARDRNALEQALATCAAATKRTARALFALQLAEARADAKDDRGAAQALREAAHADQTLELVRIIGEALARRSGDVREVARVARSSGLGPLAASARLALASGATKEERRLLAEASEEEHPDPAALLATSDAAAEAGDLAELCACIGREAERIGGASAPARLVALADLHEERGDSRESARVLREVRRHAPGDPLACRRLAELTRKLAPQKSAVLWAEEGAHAEGERAAFAHAMAGRILEATEGDAQDAYQRALEKCPGYPPAMWAEEDRARRSGDPAKLRAMVIARAEGIPDARAAAELLVRGALAGTELDRDLLERASDLVPEDAALADLRIRAGGLTAAMRGELLENASVATPDAFARVLLVRAAEAFEEAGDLARAASLLVRALAHAPNDPVTTRALDRVQLAAGDVDAVEARMRAAVDAAPDDTSSALALERLAELELYRRGDAVAALDAYRAIIARYPSHVASVRGVERLTMELGDDVGLLQIEEQLARLGHPKDATSHARLATRLRTRLEGVRAADALLIATFEYGQADLWLTRQIEAIARERGDERLLSQALAEMAELLEEPRERVSVELRTAEIGGGVRSPSAAANRLARALAIDPKHPTIAEALGALRESAGDANGAADAYAEAAKRARSDARKAELNYHAGRLYEERVRDVEHACTLYFEAARADASAHDVLGRLERLLPVHGDARRLADIVSTYVSKGGERGHLVSLHLMHARLRRALGDAASAKKSLRTVTTFEPERTDAFELLAAICIESNDPRGAAEAYQKIVVTSRDQDALRRAYLALADLFAASKDTRRAKEALRKLIEIFPDDSEAKQRLALMESTR